jgi:hypothetical protein
MRQTEGSRRFLFCQGFNRYNIFVLKRTGSAELHALRIAIAKVTVMRHTFVRRKTHHAKGTRKETHFAADTTVIEDFDLTVRLPLNSHGRTHRRARRIGTVYTNHRLIELFFIEIGDPNTGECRKEPSLMRERTREFTFTTRRALFLMNNDLFHTPSYAAITASSQLRLIGRTQTAEFLIINQLSDLRMIAAHQAIRITPQFQHPHFGTERVEVNHPANKRPACP